MATTHPIPTHPRFKNLIGQTFNRLTVIDYLGQTNDGRTSVWLCRCVCGKETKVTAANLRSGSVKGCGCARRLDRAGKTFGRLTVVSFAWMDGVLSRWLCRCTCGKGAVPLGRDLISGGVRSCGCLKSEGTRARQFEDLTGRRFGRLVVVECAGQAKRHDNYRWRCRCDCGNVIIAKASALKERCVRNCGCVRRKHMKTYSPEYRSWRGMKTRCFDAKNPAYPNYGGRGISVYPGWVDSFQAFLGYIGPKPSPMHTLNRINNDGNYEPGNVRWALPREQANNRRSTLAITYDGETLSSEEWSRRTGIPACTIRRRLEHGWSDEAAVATPVRRKQPAN